MKVLDKLIGGEKWTPGKPDKLRSVTTPTGGKWREWFGELGQAAGTKEVRLTLDHGWRFNRHSLSINFIDLANVGVGDGRLSPEINVHVFKIKYHFIELPDEVLTDIPVVLLAFVNGRRTNTDLLKDELSFSNRQINFR